MKQIEFNIQVTSSSQLVKSIQDLESELSTLKSELEAVKGAMQVNWSGKYEDQGKPKLLDGTEKTALEMLSKIAIHYIDHYQLSKNTI